MKYKHPLFSLLLAGMSFTATAQQDSLKLPALTKGDKDSVVYRLIQELPVRYVFPDTAEKIITFLRQLQKSGYYPGLQDGPAFAASLSADLKRISNDRHLRVRYSADVIANKPERDILTIPEDEKVEYGKYLQRMNYGIRAVEVMEGNIGYIDFSLLCDPEFAGDTYVAAMNYLSHTDALIIDLRKCRGSLSENAIPMLCSYFFQSPVHLNDLYWRKGDRRIQFWTYAYVTGKRYVNKPIYVLTSFSSFSGAEELAYDLQQLKRATIIGQPTGGGANPGGSMRLTDHFSVFMPLGRAINPVTQTNWEGIGVIPDTSVNPKSALAIAKEMAYSTIMNSTKDSAWKNNLLQLREKIRSSRKDQVKVEFSLKGYPEAKQVFLTGSFNDWAPKATPMELRNGVWFVKTDAEKGKLLYQFIIDGKPVPDPFNPLTETYSDRKCSVKNLE